ncbi:MAG: hypothetical protein IH626_01790 [Rhodospirillales bacterium]|nr:hypothetical protein [Rhodospirillales bacterium]
MAWDRMPFVGLGILLMLALDAFDALPRLSWMGDLFGQTLGSALRAGLFIGLGGWTAGLAAYGVFQVIRGRQSGADE